jgi:tetratricopeptide (TPR) repeat protein
MRRDRAGQGVSHMAGIFVSYRRDDAADAAGRICDHLVDRFGEQVFFDVDAVPPGVDFVQLLESEVAKCDVLIAVIGPRWLTIQDHQGQPRLQNPGDFVRIEIAAALARNVAVFPVLVGGAAMPRADDLVDDLKLLARRQAFQLQPAAFRGQIELLVRGIVTSRKTRAGSLNAKAEQARDAGALSEAIALWKEALELVPDDTQIRESLDAADKRLATERHRFDAAKSKGQAAIARRDYAQAVASLREAAQLRPGDADVAGLLASAERELTLHRELDTRLWTVRELTAKGRELSEKKQYADALIVWADALRFSEGNPEILALMDDAKRKLEAARVVSVAPTPKLASPKPPSPAVRAAKPEPWRIARQQEREQEREQERKSVPQPPPRPAPAPDFLRAELLARPNNVELRRRYLACRTAELAELDARRARRIRGAMSLGVGVTFAILSTWVIGRWFPADAPWWLWPALCVAYWSATFPLLVRDDKSLAVAAAWALIFGTVLQLISAYVGPAAALYLSHIMASLLFPAISATANIWWSSSRKDGDIGPLPPSSYVLHNERLGLRYLR